jgi:REP element-mobilizing transposase RayT
MPQSLSKVIIHIIFSTKNREPWLDSSIRPRMRAYLATICRDLGGEVLCVGGVSDHVHIVTTLPRTLSQAELIEQIKKPSSKWIKAIEARYRGFSWQRGYAVFSVSPSQLEACCNTCRDKKNTIVLTLFKTNTGSCCAGTALSSTSNMFRIEVKRCPESRLQRCL